MCIFIGSRVGVAETSIYASFDPEAGRQLLVYQMGYATSHDAIMVLPLPVDRQRQEAYDWIEIGPEERFFERLKAATEHATLDAIGAGSGRSVKAPLPVERVGSYLATYVPDVERLVDLDPALALAPPLREQLAARYPNWAFAAVKLSPTLSTAVVHPIAISFVTRFVSSIFFPTTHLHDGESLPAFEKFRHTLYGQVAGLRPCDPFWSSYDLPDADLPERVRRDVPLLRADIQGERPNADVYLRFQAR